MRKIFWILVSFPALIKAQIQPECATLQNIFNTSVEVSEKICVVEIIRDHLEVTYMGKSISPKTIDLAYQIAFEKIDNQTVVIGELALLEDEVNEVMDELRKGNIEVSAIHNHMIYEQPRIVHLHFQGMGDLNQQAIIIKRAIEKTAK